MVSLFSQGLQLMLYGMGTVVVFLTTLVLATRLMSVLLSRFSGPEPTGDSLPSQPSLPSPSGAHLGRSVDPRVLAAVTAAVHTHRATRN